MGIVFCREKLAIQHHQIRSISVAHGRLGVAEVLRCREKLAIQDFMRLLFAGSAEVQDAVPACTSLWPGSRTATPDTHLRWYITRNSMYVLDITPQQ